MSNKKFAVWCLLFFYRTFGLKTWYITYKLTRQVLDYFKLPYCIKNKLTGTVFLICIPTILDVVWKWKEITLKVSTIKIERYESELFSFAGVANEG